MYMYVYIYIYIYIYILLGPSSAQTPSGRFAACSHSNNSYRQTGSRARVAEIHRTRFIMTTVRTLISGPEKGKRKRVTRKADGKLTLLVNLGGSWHEKLTLLVTHFSLPISGPQH